ncbi:alpha/beta hydrolase [Parapusillimonas sp. SGNA-6]|nr:alpha/beta hydrolase [Parapusillimonas sp. SGNA-6]
MSQTHTNITPSTFVLVHGAWHGGWCWSRVAERLRAQGHRVYTPTLTGLGERHHLLHDGITLHTFIDDVVNVLTFEALEDVVLVGHSFGGVVITGVADRVPERLRRLIYLDGFLLENGVSTFDTLPPDVVEKIRAKSQPPGNGAAAAAIPTPQARHLGLSETSDLAFVEGRLTPQPLGSYETALALKGPIGNGLPCTYLHCTSPSYGPVEGSRAWVKQQGTWQWGEVAAGHDAMVSHPDAVAEALTAHGGR